MPQGNETAASGGRQFVVVSDSAGFVPPDIVVQYDPGDGSGANWPDIVKLPLTWSTYPGKLRDAVQFLQDAIEKMTGRTLAVRSSADLLHGIVFTTLAGATPDIRDDRRVRRALANDGSDAYNANEAYYIRAETERTILVANTHDGLINAAAELAESVGYHVLGMGPNWVDVPDRSDSLVFRTESSGRPGYYLRALWPMSGQDRGQGTIYDRPLSDPADEPVEASFQRWRVGARLAGHSTPRFPGHTLQAYHQKMADHIRDTGETVGFLRPVRLGTEAQRLATPASTMPEHLWIASDGPPAPAHAKVYLSRKPDKDSAEVWMPQHHTSFASGVVLDLSVPAVRSIILDGAKQGTETGFNANPDAVVPMAFEREDGGVADPVFMRHTKNPNWYPEYLAREGLPFGEPYALHGSFDLDQPNELWDPTSPTDPTTQSDAMFALAHWLLREYDRWIDSLPEERRVTRSGASKKSQVRAAFYSYNYHDVPPQFNVRDPRVCVMIAGYSKHRRYGKWTAFQTQLDIARALQVWLPEPSADYRYLSIATAWDLTLSQLPVIFDFSPSAISANLSEYFDAGVKAIQAETDFNFGKCGLGYYLTAKQLWNPAMTAEELDAIRDQWLRRAFGTAWRTMKQYYDFMLLPNYPVNSTSSWGHAVALITEADKQIDPATESAVKRRIDDLKQYWYFYYLFDTGKWTDTAPETKEFVWKGQMSYMNAMFALMGKVYGTYDPAVVAGSTASGPAHYTAAETAAWWEQVRTHWPEIEVDRFEDATLANGVPASMIDLNDLTLVEEFVWPGTYGQFYYNPGQEWPKAFLTTATKRRQPIGFTLWWPNVDNDARFRPAAVHYGLQWWNPWKLSWETVLDQSTTATHSVDTPKHRVVQVAVPAPKPGVFRFSLGSGGYAARLAPLAYDIDTAQPTGRSAHTYAGLALAHTNAGRLYFYIPNRTRSLHLDIWHEHGIRNLRIYSDLLSNNPKASYREVDISKLKTYTDIELQPGEDGTIAVISAPTTFLQFPYLHSVPRLWAMSPAELLVPRAIAAADGLTPSA
jgi:hypothetical protein